MHNKTVFLTILILIFALSGLRANDSPAEKPVPDGDSQYGFNIESSANVTLTSLHYPTAFSDLGVTLVRRGHRSRGLRHHGFRGHRSFGHHGFRHHGFGYRSFGRHGFGYRSFGHHGFGHRSFGHHGFGHRSFGHHGFGHHW